MPKSSIDAVTLNTKEITVKLPMANLTVEEVNVLGLLLMHIGAEQPLTRLPKLRSLLEQYHKGGK